MVSRTLEPLKGNVETALHFLAINHQPGDELFIFGFSRGAYTVRALAGFIQYSGILDIDYYSKQPFEVLTRKIQHCWDDFRTVAFKAGPAQERRPRAERDEASPNTRRRAISSGRCPDAR